MQKYFKDFLAYQKSRRITPSTISTLERQVSVFIRWAQINHCVNDARELNRSHIKAYQLYLATRTNEKGLPLKPAYVNTIIWAVQLFLNYLYKEDLLCENLANYLERVKMPKRLPSGIIEYEDFQALINTLDMSSPLGIRDRAIIELFYSSGMRVCEIHRLDIKDVDLKERTARVIGKGDKERMVVFGKDATQALENYLKAVRPFVFKAADSKALFLSKRGKRLHISMYWYRLRDLSTKAGISRISAHTFRRSCTTELVKGNANLYHVKELLGHESLDTLKHYTKLNVGDLKKTLKKCHPRK